MHLSEEEKEQINIKIDELVKLLGSTEIVIIADSGNGAHILSTIINPLVRIAILEVAKALEVSRLADERERDGGVISKKFFVGEE